MGQEWVHSDYIDSVHVIGVALKVQLAQSVIRARVVKDTDGAHLIAHDYLILAQSGDSCDFVFAGVRVVYFLSLGTNPQTLFLPFDSHFHKDSVYASVIFFGIEVDHSNLFITVLE